MTEYRPEVGSQRPLVRRAVAPCRTGCGRWWPCGTAATAAPVAPAAGGQPDVGGVVRPDGRRDGLLSNSRSWIVSTSLELALISMMSTSPCWTISRISWRYSCSVRKRASWPWCSGLRPGADRPKAMSASLASARMKSRQDGIGVDASELAVERFLHGRGQVATVGAVRLRLCSSIAYRGGWNESRRGEASRRVRVESRRSEGQVERAVLRRVRFLALILFDSCTFPLFDSLSFFLPP